MEKIDFSCDEVINGILNKVLELIKGDNEIFLSEDDFKFSFAQAAANVEGVGEIILEYPIKTEELYKEKDNDHMIQNSFLRKYFGGKKCSNCSKECECESENYCDNCDICSCDKCGILRCGYTENDYLNDKYKKDRSFVDISFEYKGVRYFVELKYKIAETRVQRYGVDFELSQQGAANNGLYYIYEDIERMEAIKCKYGEDKTKTFVILITNDHLYWTDKTEGTYVYDVRFDFQENDKDELETLNGIIAYKNSGKYQRILHIDNRYKGKFAKFKETNSTNNNVFACLVIDLNGTGNSK